MHKTLSTVAGAALALLLLGGNAEAQGAPTPGLLGFGYVSNAPDMLVGATLWTVIPGLQGWGLYLDAKMDPEDPVGDGFLYGGLTAVEAEQQWPNDLKYISNSRWRGFNVAITKALTDEMVLYLGGGYAEETVYKQYKDSQENRGILGWYWVEDPDASRTGVNVLVGGFLRIAKSVRIQFGGETRPAGFTVGLSYVLGGQ
jgi:hypothetical protein